ncbi:hypothetical protein ACF0H5_023926 [Mactra antiquata]
MSLLLLCLVTVGYVCCMPYVSDVTSVVISPYRWDAYTAFIHAAYNYGFRPVAPVSAEASNYNYVLGRFDNYDLTFDVYNGYKFQRCQVQVTWLEDEPMKFDDIRCW